MSGGCCTGEFRDNGFLYRQGGLWWLDGFAYAVNYCPFCGAKLNPDGSVVPPVAPNGPEPSPLKSGYLAPSRN